MKQILILIIYGYDGRTFVLFWTRTENHQSYFLNNAIYSSNSEDHLTMNPKKTADESSLLNNLEI